MTSIASRKKSIISTVGIEQPVANNTLLNKGASESLYQQCSRLRARLLRIPNFDRYFALATPASQSRQSTDPVTQLWDCLALGAPLCALYNMLPIQWMDPSLPIEGNPGPRQITVNYDPATFDASNEKDKKKAIMSFMIKAFDHFPECERFNLTEIAGSRESSDGFTKVVRLVSRILESLPDDVFSVDDQSDASTFAPSQSTDSLATNGTDTTLVNLTAKGRERINTLKEILMTERKYVQDLENMQRYAELAQGPLGGDVIHHLFPNLKQLLNFQRGFLIRFEGVAENPVNEQRWGIPFIEREPDFSVYEPYCANFNAALELSSSLQDALSVGPQASLIGFPELSAYLIKPIQRLCKYPLLLDQLIKTTEPDEYAYIDELKEGSAAAKRILDRINEAQRRADNVVAVENLRYRVEDWKGHALANFGELIRDDIFIVTKSDVDREYHVFLFQKIILCCKEVYQPPQSAKKVNKSNSILKKQQPPPTPSALPGGVGAPKKKNTPLLLKGRIFLTNVTQAIPSRTNGFSLAVWWNGEDDEYFTLRCRTEDQMTGWENAINKLIKETAERRASERLSDARARSVAGDSPLTRNSPNGYERGPSSSISGRSSMAGSAAGRARPTTPFGEDFRSSEGFPRNVGGGPNGYPSSDFFENDGDEYEDYPPALSAAPSGRGTPLGSRRSNGSRTPVGYNEDSRSSSYSNNPPPMPPPVNGLPSGPAARGTFSRPSVSRVSSTLSGASSDGSFGPGAGRRSGSGLRNQMSSTRLNSQYDQQPDTRNTLPSQPAVPSSGLNRSRSQSQPSAYVPRQAQPPPPLPNMGRWDEQSPADGSKRGSGSSQSTGTQDSSDYSPEASSPATPYGGSDTSLGGGEPSRGIRGTGNQHRIKVHFHEDIFMIQVSAQVEFADLVEKLGKKIRLCGTRRDDAPLRVKYRDEDGDLVSLGSTEDVQLAFETCQPGSSVTLFVQ